MKRLVIDIAAIRCNLSVIRERAGTSVIYGALTGDGYGVGLAELAGILRENGIDRFAVNSTDDARTLRTGGFETEEILMLHSTMDPRAISTMLDLNVVFTIGSQEAGELLNRLAGEKEQLAKAHILIDTGMGFGGFLPQEKDKLLSLYQYLPYVEPTGIYTHLYSAGNDITASLDRFSSAVDAIRLAGFEPGLCHAASSSALMTYGHTQLSAVRVGSAVLGQCRAKKGEELKGCCHGEATLDSVRWLPKGSTIGNEQLATLRQDTRVAIIPVGYLNGFGQEHSRQISLLARAGSWVNQHLRSVTINGQQARIIGKVRATETAIDVSDIQCQPGDIALFDIDPLFAQGLERYFVDSLEDAEA